jgi:hypothetical protein
MGEILPPVRIGSKAGWAVEPVWTWWENPLSWNVIEITNKFTPSSWALHSFYYVHTCFGYAFSTVSVRVLFYRTHDVVQWACQICDTCLHFRVMHRQSINIDTWCCLLFLAHLGRGKYVCNAVFGYLRCIERSLIITDCVHNRIINSCTAQWVGLLSM